MFFCFLFFYVLLALPIQSFTMQKRSSPPIAIPLHSKHTKGNQSEDKEVVGCCAGTYANSIFFIEGLSSKKSVKFSSKQTAIIQKAIEEHLVESKYNDPYDFKKLIEENPDADVCQAGTMGMTLLHLAARQNIDSEKTEQRIEQIQSVVEAIQLLWDRNADFNAQDDTKKTPFDTACLLRKPQEIIFALQTS